MPLLLTTAHPSLLIRRTAFERAGLTRAVLDTWLNLTEDEFRVEGDLVCIGPVHDDDGLERLLAELELAGLRHFDDYFDLSGLWPPWLALFAMTRRDRATAVPAAEVPNEAS